MKQPDNHRIPRRRAENPLQSTRTAMLFTAIAVSLLLSACKSSENANPATTPSLSHSGQRSPEPLAGTSSSMHAYADPAWGFQIDVPARWTSHQGFSKSYLANGAWKTFAAPDSHGTPVLALIVPGSNHITDAEIRIGTSEAAQAVRNCTTPPQTVRDGSITTATINGTRFARFEAGDAAMSHHLQVHAYRTVHDGICYAIDLLVYGVNPQVYDPPATPPFSDEQALARMQKVVETFRFTR